MSELERLRDRKAKADGLQVEERAKYQQEYDKIVKRIAVLEIVERNATETLERKRRIITGKVAIFYTWLASRINSEALDLKAFNSLGIPALESKLHQAFLGGDIAKYDIYEESLKEAYLKLDRIWREKQQTDLF